MMEKYFAALFHFAVVVGLCLVCGPLFQAKSFASAKRINCVDASNCEQQLQEDDYCNRPDTMDFFRKNCPKACGLCGVCCQAQTATCLACQANQTVEEYCKLNPLVTGCSIVCEDEIPSTCNKTAPLNNCSNIIAFGQSLGVSLQCLCDIEWKNVQENQITQGSCDSTTPGQLKDTCKVSCNTCPTTDCKDNLPVKRCKKLKKNCKKSIAKKNCKKTCKLC